jgi:hypothetical protein
VKVNIKLKDHNRNSRRNSRNIEGEDFEVEESDFLEFPNIPET